MDLSQPPLPYQIRPIDKKLEYQIQKLLKAAQGGLEGLGEGGDGGALEGEEALQFRPNPDMLLSKLDDNAEVSVRHMLMSSPHKTNK